MAPKLTKIAGQLGIADLLKKYPYEVSGGQKQRVAVARDRAKLHHFQQQQKHQPGKQDTEPKPCCRTGEREPKAKWLQAVLAVVCLGVGYAIAVTTENPIRAMAVFFFAVILVMAGGDLVFFCGSGGIFRFNQSLFRFHAGFFCFCNTHLFRRAQKRSLHIPLIRTVHGIAEGRGDVYYVWIRFYGKVSSAGTDAGTGYDAVSRRRFRCIQLFKILQIIKFIADRRHMRNPRPVQTIALRI